MLLYVQLFQMEELLRAVNLVQFCRLLSALRDHNWVDFTQTLFQALNMASTTLTNIFRIWTSVGICSLPLLT